MKGVRLALNDSIFMIGLSSEKFAHAKYFGKKLIETKMFEMIGKFDVPESYKPQKGDIVIFGEMPNKPSDSGHTAIFDGESWVAERFHVRKKDIYGSKKRREIKERK